MSLALEKFADQGGAPSQGKSVSLKSRILRAGSWSVAGHLFGQVLRIGSSLIMTRLLAPEMFGVMAMAIVVQVVISLLSDIGLRQAIVQSPRGDSPALLNTAWTIQVLRGGLIWAVCLLVAVSLWAARALGWLTGTSAYAATDLPMAIAAFSFSAVIMGFQSTRAVTSSRDLDLKRLTLIELVAQVTGLFVMVMLGWITRSIWAMVAGMLIGSMITVVSSHTLLPGAPNRFEWHAESVRELVGYGRWVLLSSLLYVLAANGDRLLLGGWVSASTLGLYSLAIGVAAMVDGMGSRLFGAVAMPALSEVRRNTPDRFRALYYRMRLPFDIAFIGSAGLLFATGSLIVDLLYDQRYGEAGSMLQVLSFSLIFARFGLSGSAFLALGQPKALTWIHVVRLISMFVLVPLLYSLFGFQGALYAIAFHVAPTLPLLYWLNSKHKLNDFKFELFVLLAWPGGYLVGELINRAAGR